MSDNRKFSGEDAIIGAFLGAVLMAIVLTVVATSIIDGNWREAISQGYAEYCPNDNTFQWRGECK